CARRRAQTPARGGASLRSPPVFYNETPKAAYFDAVALRKSIHHRIEDCINDHFRISSREMRKSFVHLVNQIPFRHNISLTTQERIWIDVWQSRFSLLEQGGRPFVAEPTSL